MATNVATRTKSGRNVRSAAVREAGEVSLPKDPAIARLISDSAALLQVADSLERLAADLHKSYRARDAQELADSLNGGLGRHLDDEAALLRTVEADGDKELERVVDRTRDEHRALHELVDPVIRDLRDVAAVGLPTQPNRFVIEAMVLCEFIRLHVRYKRQTVYPLLGATYGRRPLTAERLDNKPQARNEADTWQAP